MKNIPLLIGTILGTLVLIVVVAFMFSGGDSSSQETSINVDPVVAMGEARNSKIAGEEIVGEMMPDEDEDATSEAETEEVGESEIITIVEFSDFQCPACANAAPLASSVVDAFPGKVKLVYRHFPLDSIHPNARKAAIAAEAVASINNDKFWDMHDMLFENQSEWSNVRDRGELTDIFVTYIEKLDIDRNEFLARIEDNSVAELVNTDSKAGTQLNVNSTPTFFVNGIKVSAQQLYSTVESLINSTD